MSRTALAATGLCMALFLIGCGSRDAPGEGGPKFLLDEKRGTYQGIGIDWSETAVFRKFGKARRSDGITPLGDDYYEVGGPTSQGPPRAFRPVHDLRYRGVSFQIQSEKVFSFMVTAPGTATARGIRIGDSLERVRAAYPEVQCGTANEGSEYQTFPVCVGKLGLRRWILFGQDPVRSITLSITPLRG